MKTSIPGYSKYQVDEFGVVYGPRGHALAPHINKGVLAVKIHNDAGKRIGLSVHRAVAMAFLELSTGWRIRHIDGDFCNNALSNLEAYDYSSTEDHKKTLARERSKRYARKYPEKIKAVAQKWAEDNKGKRQASVRNRQARKLKATPPWADMSAIERHYLNSAHLSKITGFVHHVDHIIPLQGKLVCGLHVENNMRVVPHYLNTRKGNSFTVEV